MKRENIAAVGVGLVAGVAACIVWQVGLGSATANPTAQAVERGLVAGEYAPGFAEHVTDHVRRHYCFEHALGAVFCSSPKRTSSGRLEWTLSGEVNHGAGDPYRKRWLRAKRNLKRDIELWQKRGYDIRWSDFRIDVKEPRPRRSDSDLAD